MYTFLLMLLLHARVWDVSYDAGRLSAYYPGDGFNRGELSCNDAKFTRSQVHIARRDWRQHGCGRSVLVWSTATGRFALAAVRDSGPWGAYRGRLCRAVADGRWRAFPGLRRPPKGWKWHASVDLSWGLWIRLGRPSGLSQVHMLFLPREPRRTPRI